MKKFIIILIYFLFFILYNDSKISAQSGTCIIKQQNKTYEVETPFYWYEVTQESTYNNTLVNSLSYVHSSNLIQTKENCLKINNKTPTFENGIYNNILNTRTTNFYYSKTELNDSKEIYEKSVHLFNVPSFLDTDGFQISATYISFDNLPPIIANDIVNSTIIVNVNQKFSTEQIKEKITAYDETDGIIDVKIHEDNYSKNYTTLGTYSIVFSATDNSGNTAYLSINIKVIDTIKPQISGPSKINSYMSNPLTIDQIKETLTITDNYDTNLKSSIIVEDNYTNNTSIEGTFIVTFITHDNSYNESLPFYVEISMIDDISPIIEGLSSYTVNIKNLLKIDTFLNQLKASDNVDPQPLIEVQTDSYSANYYKTGIYQISFIAKDKSNNVSTPFIINIIAEDTEKPIFYISQKFIGVDSNTKIPIENLIDIVSEINDINLNDINNISIISDTYSPNFPNTGTYKLQLKYEYNNDTHSLLETNIIIFDNTPKEKANKNTPKRTFWCILKNLFEKLINFIKRIFTFFRKLI